MKYIFIVLSLFILSCSSKTFYVVRHAEKAVVPAGADRMTASDPPLSDAGVARAAELNKQMAGKGIRHIFSTNYKRTRSTVQPLSEAKGIPITLYSPAADSMSAFIDKVINQTKGNVLIAGHSNTIDDIANKLAGKQVVPGDLPETDYDNIFIIKKKGKKLTFERITYGVSTN